MNCYYFDVYVKLTLNGHVTMSEYSAFSTAENTADARKLAKAEAKKLFPKGDVEVITSSSWGICRKVPQGSQVESVSLTMKI